MLRRLLPFAAVAGVCWWVHAQRSTPAEAKVEETVRYVPLAGASLIADLAPGRCLPMVDELVTHPNWSIGVADVWWGCTGSGVSAGYEIHADGTVDYTAHGLTRRLRLSGVQRSAFLGLGRLDCVRDVEGGYTGTTFSVAAGAPAEDFGAQIPAESTLGRALGKILDDARGAYVDARIAELGGVRLDLRYRRFRVELDGLTLKVRRHGRVVGSHALTPEQLVDLADTITGHHVAQLGAGEAEIRGTFSVGDTIYKLRLPRWLPDVWAPLGWALDGAEE